MINQRKQYSKITVALYEVNQHEIKLVLYIIKTVSLLTCLDAVCGVTVQDYTIAQRNIQSGNE